MMSIQTASAWARLGLHCCHCLAGIYSAEMTSVEMLFAITNGDRVRQQRNNSRVPRSFIQQFTLVRRMTPVINTLSRSTRLISPVQSADYAAILTMITQLIVILVIIIIIIHAKPFSWSFAEWPLPTMTWHDMTRHRPLWDRRVRSSTTVLATDHPSTTVASDLYIYIYETLFTRSMRFV